MPARQPDAPQGPVRIMVVGDSVAWNLGIGLLAWSEEDPHLASVWNMSTYGCGIGRGGRRPGIPRTLGQLHDCDSWADWWEVQVARFRPDVVVVHSAIWDVVDRVLPQWGHVRRPGDPAFDDWLVSEYEQAVDVLSSRGAHVVWVTAPCFGPSPPGDRFARAGAFSADRHRHLRDVIVPRLVALRPDRVSVYDLFATVCPRGRYRLALPGVGVVRQDGVHLSPHGATWVAEELGPFAIASAGFGPPDAVR
jgi:hypothetical protein